MTPSGSDEHILSSSSSSSSSSLPRSSFERANWTASERSGDTETSRVSSRTIASKSSQAVEQEAEGDFSKQPERRRSSVESAQLHPDSRLNRTPNRQMIFQASGGPALRQYAKAAPLPLEQQQHQDNNRKLIASTKQAAPQTNILLGNKVRGRKARNLRQTLKNWLILGLFFIGLIVCVSSLACLLLLPTFVSQQISRKLVLKNGSMLLERWSKPNVPMYFKVWIFNIKNGPELVGKRGVKPQVEELGPFVFNLKRQKDVISFAGENLYYTERKIYKFNRELSCCAINTSVTIPNIPLVAVVDRALSYNLPLVGRFIPRLINRAIQTLREPMFVRKQVGEILFDGYDVELLRMVSRIGSLVGLPQQSQRFALLKGRNDTWRPEQDGVWAINTGQKQRHQFGRVSSWNSYRKLPFWPAPQCNVINGSDGTLFPPPIKRTEPLYIFNQELCRTVNLVFDRPSDIRSIQAYRFVLNPMNFAHTMTPSSATSTATSSSAASLLRPPNQQHLAATLNNQRPALVQAQKPTSAASATRGPRKQEELMRASSSEQRGSLSTSQAHSSAEQHQAAAAARNQANSDLRTNNDQEKSVLEVQRLAAERHKHSDTPLNPHTCFCDRKTTHLNGINVCEFDGLIDLSKCSKQAQVIFGSMPHFFNSDPRLPLQVDGMQPNASRHTTYLDIEPNTGLVLGGKRRVQLNLIVKRNNEIDGFENINDMLLPIVWFEESAQIPEEAAQKFKSLYTDRIRLVNLTLLSLFVASLALLAINVRLMLSSHHWTRFKWLVSANGGGGGKSGSELAANRYRQKREQKQNGWRRDINDTQTSSESDDDFNSGTVDQQPQQARKSIVLIGPSYSNVIEQDRQTYGTTSTGPRVQSPTRTALSVGNRIDERTGGDNNDRQH